MTLFAAMRSDFFLLTVQCILAYKAEQHHHTVDLQPQLQIYWDTVQNVKKHRIR